MMRVDEVSRSGELTVVDQLEGQRTIGPDRHIVGAAVGPLDFELGLQLPGEVQKDRRKVAKQFQHWRFQKQTLFYATLFRWTP